MTEAQGHEEFPRPEADPAGAAVPFGVPAPAADADPTEVAVPFGLAGSDGGVDGALEPEFEPELAEADATEVAVPFDAAGSDDGVDGAAELEPLEPLEPELAEADATEVAVPFDAAGSDVGADGVAEVTESDEAVDADATEVAESFGAPMSYPAAEEPAEDVVQPVDVVDTDSDEESDEPVESAAPALTVPARMQRPAEQLPEPVMPQPPHTGDPRVDEVVGSLQHLGDHSSEEHVRAYEAAHGGLQEVLADLDRDTEGE